MRRKAIESLVLVKASRPPPRNKIPRARSTALVIPNCVESSNRFLMIRASRKTSKSPDPTVIKAKLSNTDARQVSIVARSMFMRIEGRDAD
jgi:hypothetical protein